MKEMDNKQAFTQWCDAINHTINGTHDKYTMAMDRETTQCINTHKYHHNVIHYNNRYLVLQLTN